MSDDARVSMASERQPAWLRTYAESPEQQERLYRRTLWIVVVSQMFGGMGLAAGIAVGALLARDMLGTDGMAGLPVALLTLGSAASALLVGRLSERSGRRVGLTAGFIAGGLGAVGVVAAAAISNVALLFASFVVYGAGTATNLQARYAGTDLARPSNRAKAVSVALVSTTFGAVAGPNLVDVTGRAAEAFGIPALAGPFMLAAAAFLLAGSALFIWLRPDPLLVAQAISAARSMEGGNRDGLAEDGMSGGNRRGIAVGASVMVLTQVVMTAIMTMTPIHMGHHGHGLGSVGLVIGIHVGAMFLPSLVTGMLVDKVGRVPMAVAAALTLLASGILSAAVPADSLIGLAAALALLGLGWNFGLISGTTLIVDSAASGVRAKTQGAVDVLIALTGASSGALSGVVVAHTSYAALSLAGGALAMLLIPIVAWSRRPRSR